MSFESSISAERLLSEEERRFLAHDVYRAGTLPDVAVRPRNADELQSVVRAAVANDYAVVVRGGGVSYTDGYLPTRERTVLIDTTDLNRILEINERDMYVTVEPGISWSDLHAKLGERGLKVPFVGTFSGLAASVGGTISQNANGMGSNGGGIAPESVIGVRVLDGRGEWVQVGVSGDPENRGNFRFFGADMTGLFTGDCGTLGVKAAVTLKLVRRRSAFQGASFSFQSFEALHNCMAELAGERLDEKSFGLDMALSQGQIAKQDASSTLAIAKNVLLSSPNLIVGLATLARMGLAGKKFLSAAPYAVHYIVEAHTDGEARQKITTLRGIALKHGQEIANSVPTVVRAMPFQPLHNMLGPKGERWVPLHGLIPHSKVSAFHQAFIDYVAEMKAEMDAKGVHVGAMFSTIGAGTFLYEPAIYWKDEVPEFHQKMMEADYFKALPTYPVNPDGAALVEKIRNHIITLMHQHGAAHFQVGKLYPYQQSLDAGAARLLKAIKAELDPKGLLNPGALGF